MAVRSNFEISEILMAEEFIKANSSEVCKAFADAIARITLRYDATYRAEKTSSRRDRFDPYRRHDSVCQYDPYFWAK